MLYNTYVARIPIVTTRYRYREYKLHKKSTQYKTVKISTESQESCITSANRCSGLTSLIVTTKITDLYTRQRCQVEDPTLGDRSGGDNEQSSHVHLPFHLYADRSGGDNTHNRKSRESTWMYVALGCVFPLL